MVRRIRNEGMTGDAPEHLCRPEAERQLECAKYVRIELVLGLVEQTARAYDAGDTAAPFSSDRRFKEGLGVGVLAERNTAITGLDIGVGINYLKSDRKCLSPG
jgi:hypothetical protein